MLVIQFVVVQIIVWVLFGNNAFYVGIAGIIGLAHGLALLTSSKK